MYVPTPVVEILPPPPPPAVIVIVPSVPEAVALTVDPTKSSEVIPAAT